MTTERDPDSEATVEMPRIPNLGEELEDMDPEQTFVREDVPQDSGANEAAAGENWETTVMRRIAGHVTAVQSEVEEDPEGEARFGWESVGLRRLSQEVLRDAK